MFLTFLLKQQQRISWPSHWPGNHSPMIMQAIMQTGEVNGKQMLDPRTKDMKLRLNMVGSLSRHGNCNHGQGKISRIIHNNQSDPRFTNGDRSLVNMVIGKINRQITFAEQEIERARMTRPDPTQGIRKGQSKRKCLIHTRVKAIQVLETEHHQPNRST